MKTKKIKQLFDETSTMLSTLYSVSSANGIHLDNDLETGLFMLLLDENYNEIVLLKNRIKTAIQKINDGTFKIKDIEDITSTQKVA
jgi:hypothetical protein